MICEMIEHHRVTRINGVSTRQQLHTNADGIGSFAVQLQDGKSHDGTDAFRVQFKRPLEGLSSLILFVELHEAVANAEAYSSYGW